MPWIVAADGQRKSANLGQFCGLIKADAEAALKAAQPELHSGVSKGVLHKNAAARKISRLTKRIRAL